MDRMCYCQVCGDSTMNYSSYGGIVCSSCRVFFRRQANKTNTRCYYGGHCQITRDTRSYCQTCRLEKCLAIGMDPSRIKKRRIPSDQIFEFKDRYTESEIHCFIFLSLFLQKWDGLSKPNKWNLETSHWLLDFDSSRSI